MMRQRDQLSLRVDLQLAIDVLQVGLDGVEADEELVGNLSGFDALLGQTAHALLRRRQGVRIHFSMMLASVCQRQLFTAFRARPSAPQSSASSLARLRRGRAARS